MQYGVLSGFIILPTGEERQMAMFGTIEEISDSAQVLGLIPDRDQLQALLNGKKLNTIHFGDGHGSFATCTTVNFASDFLARVAPYR